MKFELFGPRVPQGILGDFLDGGNIVFYGIPREDDLHPKAWGWALDLVGWASHFWGWALHS